MTASGDTLTPTVGWANAPSAYAGQMPKLREFAQLSAADPRRSRLREELILAFRPVVEHLALRYANPVSGTAEELTQVGTVALIVAIDRWDAELARGEFLGYLIPCVRGEMLRWIRDRTWAMHVPRRLKDLGVVLKRASGRLSHELGRAPRPSELAAYAGTTVEEVIEALDARASRQAGALDEVDGQTGTPLVERLGALDAELEKVDYRHALRPLMEALPERERMIVMLRFFGEMTQTQIGQQLGISQMHVSRLLARTLKQLRGQLVDGPQTD